MSQTSISIDCVTITVGNELLHIAVDSSQLAAASILPSLHEQGLRAKHLTIPFKPRARGPRAGWYWIHLTYPDGAHKDVAWLHPDMLRDAGKAIEASFQGLVRERLLANVREIDARWLAAEGYKLAFMWNDEFPGWADTYFKNKGHHYRVSEARLKQSASDMWIGEPELLDVEEFVSNHPGNLQAFSWDGSKKALAVWRFPWGPDGSYHWYAAPNDYLMPAEGPFFETVLRLLGTRFWEGVRTILIELGIPADYDRLDQFLGAMKEGRLDILRDVGRQSLTAM